MGSIPGQGARTPHASQLGSQNIKQKQYCSKFNKDFESSSTLKKNLRKKNCKLEIEIPFQVIFNLKKLRMLSLACMHPQSLSHGTLQTLSMEFSRQEY